VGSVDFPFLPILNLLLGKMCFTHMSVPFHGVGTLHSARGYEATSFFWSDVVRYLQQFQPFLLQEHYSLRLYFPDNTT
jgi:hypothetical protein